MRWRCWQSIGLAIYRSRIRVVARNFCVYVPLSPSSTIWYSSKGGEALRHGKVTFGLASHWPCVTDLGTGISMALPAQRERKRVSTLSTSLRRGMACFTLLVGA